MTASYSHLPKTREEAVRLGSGLYFTGEPCVNGHVAPRRAKSYICKACATEAAAEQRSKGAKLTLAKQRGAFVYLAHPDDHAALLAYAHALDMARGRAPLPPGHAAHVAANPEEVYRRQMERMGLADAPMPDTSPRLPKPPTLRPVLPPPPEDDNDRLSR